MSSGAWEKNERLLRTRFPGLLERLEAESETPHQMIVAGGTAGDPTLSAAGRWVHSRVDPRREAERLAAQATGDGPLVVLGFGLGYAAEAAGAAPPIGPSSWSSVIRKPCSWPSEQGPHGAAFPAR
jgi:hypothetical protein